MGPSECVGLKSSIVELDPKWMSLVEPAWIEALDETPFLTRCRTHQVSKQELRTFVLQQYFYARHFTRFLCALLSNIGNETDRLELTQNLLEEIGFGDGNGIPHSRIYRDMMRKMEIVPNGERVLDSTQFLIDTMYECCRSHSPVVGLAALCLGAEAIVPHIYSQVVEGFQSQGESEESLEFFTIHIAGDDAHAITMRKIIERELSRDPFQISLLKLTALRALQARARFFEGIR